MLSIYIYVHNNIGEVQNKDQYSDATIVARIGENPRKTQSDL